VNHLQLSTFCLLLTPPSSSPTLFFYFLLSPSTPDQPDSPPAVCHDNHHSRPDGGCCQTEHCHPGHPGDNRGERWAVQHQDGGVYVGGGRGYFKYWLMVKQLYSISLLSLSVATSRNSTRAPQAATVVNAETVPKAGYCHCKSRSDRDTCHTVLCSTSRNTAYMVLLA